MQTILRTLTQLGVQSISLSSDGVVSAPIEGVAEAGRTSATMNDGQAMVVANVAFSYITPEMTYNNAHLDASHSVL